MRARSASGTRQIDELAEQHSKGAENTWPKRPFLEVSGRRKKNSLKLVATSSNLYIDSNTLQCDVSEGLMEIGPELRAPAPMAGSYKNDHFRGPRAADPEMHLNLLELPQVFRCVQTHYKASFVKV